MQESLFQDWVKKYFPKLVVKITDEAVNGEKAPRYYHQEMLSKKFSLDGSWKSVSEQYSNVAADIVSMDSRLDVKSRDAVATAEGDITKVGMMLALTEKQLKTLDVLIASGADDKEILTALFEDLAKCIRGVYERNELSYLTGLCTGVTLTADERDASIGVRLNFNYYDSHKFGVTADWSNPATAKPLDDIDRVLEKAIEDGYTLRHMIMKPKKLNQLRKSRQFIEAYASHKDTTATANSPAISKKNAIEFLLDEKGLAVDEMTRTIKVEKDGKRSVIDPWVEDTIVFLDSWADTGDLVWSKLAESNHREDSVAYQESDDYILSSKYREVNPLKEFTSSQALVSPIITNIGGIYIMDSATIQA